MPLCTALLALDPAEQGAPRLGTDWALPGLPSLLLDLPWTGMDTPGPFQGKLQPVLRSTGPAGVQGFHRKSEVRAAQEHPQPAKDPPWLLLLRLFLTHSHRITGRFCGNPTSELGKDLGIPDTGLSVILRELKATNKCRLGPLGKPGTTASRGFSYRGWEPQQVWWWWVSSPTVALPGKACYVWIIQGHSLKFQPGIRLWENADIHYGMNV